MAPKAADARRPPPAGRFELVTLALAVVACSTPEVDEAPKAAPSAIPSAPIPSVIPPSPKPPGRARARVRDPDPPPTPMPENALDDFELRARRTPCYGPCPVYYLEVDSKGRIRAKRLGTGPMLAGRRLSNDELSGLAKAFYDVGFFDMKSEYPADATDASTVTLELTSGGRSKRVAHDESNAAAPLGLIELEKYVEEITGARAYGFPVPTPVR